MADLHSLPWVVQKYGGTSIGKLLPTITAEIVPEYLQSHNVAVVCSARSGTSKSQGTTSLLLNAIQLVTSGSTNITAIDKAIDIIQDEHVYAAKIAIGAGTNILREVQTSLEQDCEQLRTLLKATWTLGEISDRIQDRVLAAGETLSCRIVAGSLRSKGIPANVVILDDIVESAFGGTVSRELSRAYKASPSSFLRGLTDTIRNKIVDGNNGVPVITGFFGAMPDSLISSVGRGYSDLCAALCAVALDAQELQIWKEVDGIFTADPRKIKAARLLATVTTEEASELTYYGSEVIHPLTIEQIDTAAIPLRLKNVMNPQGAGTIIYPSRSSPRSSGSSSPTSRSSGSVSTNDLVKSTFMTANGYYGESQSRRTPTAITVKEGITVLNVKSNGTSRPQTFLARVGGILQEHDVDIDLISSSQQMLSLAVVSTNPHGIKEATKALSELGIVAAMPHMSIVSVVGHKMRNMVGVAAEIFDALATAKVNVHLISQGASEINISFVVRAQESLLATQVIHTNVMRIPLHSERENSFIRGPWLY